MQEVGAVLLAGKLNRNSAAVIYSGSAYIL